MFQEARVIERNGRTYKFATNTGRRDYHHEHFKRLVEQGLPVIFDRNAYDIKDKLIPKCVAVFFATDSFDEVWGAFHRATSGTLEEARFWADVGQPGEVFILLLESEADDETKREILATAYSKAAATSNWLGKQHMSKGLIAAAKRDWRFARKLRDGKIKFGLSKSDQAVYG